MALKGTYETVKQAIQDVIAPQLQELRGEIAGLRGEMRQLEKRLEDGLSNVNRRVEDVNRRMDEGFTHVNQRMDEGFTQVNRRIDDANKRIDEAIEYSRTSGGVGSHRAWRAATALASDPKLARLIAAPPRRFIRKQAGWLTSASSPARESSWNGSRWWSNGPNGARTMTSPRVC